MKAHGKRWLWPALAGLGLMVGPITLTAGTGTLQGVVTPVCLDVPSYPVPPIIEAQLLDAKDARLVAVLPVGANFSFGGDLNTGQYRLRFVFSPSSSAFYVEGATEAQMPCFNEGTVITITEGLTTDISALVGYNLIGSIPLPWASMGGSVKDVNGGALQGILVDILDPCSAKVLVTGTTDQNGDFAFIKDIACDPTVKIRFSDPTGHYLTGFYGDNADNFIAGALVDPYEVTTVNQVLLPVSPDIEVAPSEADFGNVELPGATTAIVTIANLGGSDLQVSSISLLAGASPYISIQSAPALPVTLGAGASCEVTLEFEPQALGPAAATLAVVSDDPDESTVLVALSGQAVASAAPPAEQVATTLEFIEEAATEGTLEGTGPAGAADAHLSALLNQIKAASDLAAAGKLTQACQQLANAMQRTDGDPQPPDFVTGPAAEELRLLIELTRAAIGCK